MPELPEVETVRRGLAPVMEGARFVEVVAHRGDLRWPLPKDFVKRLEGPDGERARPPRQISARRPVVGRRAGDASRHVGLVPDRARAARDDARLLLSRPLEGHRARPRRVPHVVGRDDPLQRSAPLRLDEDRLAAKARRGAAAARARPRAARQRIRRRDAGARPARARTPASRPRCSISGSSPAWATSMSARRSIARCCRRSARPRPSPTATARRTSAPSG